VLRFEISDTGEVWTLLVANGALTPMAGPALGGEAPRLTVGLPRSALDAIVARRTTLGHEEAAGSVRCDGDRTALDELFGLLEAPTRGFPLASPQPKGEA
jgi:alkyl sulfatase BDS1-like metallo-beta-lactamase superfamily hydrolase